MQQRFWPDPQPLVKRLCVSRNLPERPGVYLMRDAGEVVLYVGKAKNLRKRLGSYRVANPERMPRRHLRLLRAVVRISEEKRREALERWRRVRVHDLRGRPVRGHPVPGRAAAVDAVAGHRATWWCTPAQLHQDGLPGRAGRLPDRPERDLIADIAKQATNLYISPGHGRRRRSCTSSASPATSTARSRRSARRWVSGPGCSPSRCARTCPRRGSWSPTAATSSGWSCRRTCW